MAKITKEFKLTISNNSGCNKPHYEVHQWIIKWLKSEAILISSQPNGSLVSGSDTVKYICGDGSVVVTHSEDNRDYRSYFSIWVIESLKPLPPEIEELLKSLPPDVEVKSS